MQDTALVRRVIHTIKGNGASYGLHELVSLIHEMESQPKITHTHLTSIADDIEAFLDTHRVVLELDYKLDDLLVFSIDSMQIVELKERLSQLPINTARSIQAWIEDVTRVPASALLGPLDEFVSDLAQRLGKQVHYKLEGGDTRVEPEVFRRIVGQIPHLIRNSLSHGIEFPEDRGDKPPQGSLCLFVHADNEHYTISVQDDGRGFDLQALEERALALQLIDLEEAKSLDNNQRILLALQNHLSTALEASSIAGRGMGMAAINEIVERNGGNINISSTPGQGAKVTIHIPRA